MPYIKSSIGAAGILALIGWSTASLAGGHAGGAPMVRPIAHASPHMQGFGAVGRGGWFRAPRPLALGSGFGWSHAGGVYGTRYGHINTGLSGPAGRLPRIGRFGWHGPRYVRSFGFDRLGYGRRRLAAYAFEPRRYGYGYGSALGAGLDYAAGPSFGYAEPSLAVTYAEPPLGPSPDAGQGGLSFEDGGEYGPSPVYGGGPRIISVRDDDRAPRPRDCACKPSSGHLPIVYRFGVGSYY